jgi:hypothetical protein
MMSAPTCECGICEKCKNRDYQRRYRQENREAVRAWSRASIKRLGRRYKPPSDAIRARTVLNKAVRRGQITRQPCEVCGESPTNHNGTSGVQAHHDDYSKPLDVRWLCTFCHAAHHRKYPNPGEEDE